MDNIVRHAERRGLDAGAPDSNATGSHADGRDADAGGFDADAGGFDADAWGASPSWHPSAGQSLYDDDDLDAELVPQARSLFAVPD
jgi:hypothetical protein